MCASCVFSLVLQSSQVMIGKGALSKFKKIIKQPINLEIQFCPTCFLSCFLLYIYIYMCVCVCCVCCGCGSRGLCAYCSRVSSGQEWRWANWHTPVPLCAFVCVCQKDLVVVRAVVDIVEVECWMLINVRCWMLIHVGCWTLFFFFSLVLGVLASLLNVFRS